MKIVAKSKDFRLTVTVKTSSREIIDEKELDRFSRLFMRCFLKPKIVKYDVLEYTGPAGISLQERMKKPVSKRDFLFILEHIVVAVQKLQSHNFPLNHLRMQMDQIYINETTKELQFLYIPASGVEENGNLVDLLQAVVYSAHPIQENDTGYVSRFHYFLNSMPVLDMNKIEQFIHREDRTIVNTIKKNNVGQSGFIATSHQSYAENAPQAAADMEATGLLEEEATGLLEEEATGLLEEEATGLLEEEATGLLEEEATGLLEEEATGLLEEEATGLLMEQEEEMPVVMEPEAVYTPEPEAVYTPEPETVYTPEPEEIPAFNFADEEATGLLMEEEPVVEEIPQAPIVEEPVFAYTQDDAMEMEEEGTCLLEETVQPRVEPKPAMAFPELHRVLTGETIKVNKPVFRIGKERSYVDYFVSNNNAVSRAHADIITRENGYFVMDLNSKNRTFINNLVLSVQVETEIHDGDILRLGNEEFEFHTTPIAPMQQVCPNCQSAIKQGAKFCFSCGHRL